MYEIREISAGIFLFKLKYSELLILTAIILAGKQGKLYVFYDKCSEKQLLGIIFNEFRYTWKFV